MSAASGSSAGRRVGRTAAFATLFRSLTRRGGPGEPGPVQRIRALPSMVRDAWNGTYPHLGKGRMATFLVALAYLVSPVDVVPEMFLAVLGLTDDAVVAMWLGGSLLVEADRYLGWRRQTPAIVDGTVSSSSSTVRSR
ncbi:YkvA family protein [Pseudonocardia nantongensis]|uniref:YkvA family protein n=1 Tax=Pseudonocardia nantongensis TaxID=1181885 RepID=UPI00397A88DC